MLQVGSVFSCTATLYARDPPHPGLISGPLWLPIRLRPTPWGLPLKTLCLGLHAADHQEGFTELTAFKTPGYTLHQDVASSLVDGSPVLRVAAAKVSPPCCCHGLTQCTLPRHNTTRHKSSWWGAASAAHCVHFSSEGNPSPLRSENKATT